MPSRRRSPERDSLDRICAAVVACRQCPRLVAHRENVARVKVRRFAHWEYWGRPLPGLGDTAARLLIVGLAPAAHGGNRTGRIFTGDPSGDWLFRALHRAGFANQPHSVSRDDGLRVHGCYICAAVRCAPPDNRPTPDEFANCQPYLERELALLPDLRCIVALGASGFKAVLRAWQAIGRQRPRGAGFGHLAEVKLGQGVKLVRRTTRASATRRPAR